MVKKKTYRLTVNLASGVPASSTSDAVDLATEVSVIKINLGAGVLSLSTRAAVAEELAVAEDELEAEDEAGELEDELEAEDEEGASEGEGTYGKQRFSVLSKQN